VLHASDVSNEEDPVGVRPRARDCPQLIESLVSVLRFKFQRFRLMLLP